MTAEKRTFGMHPNLLFDVILRQAGTLQKALLEGVMNAIDAGASSCAVCLDTHSFSIEDNGRGIQTRQEIEEFFETFGTPHKEGDAVYGRFRMGRGQMMAFGRNTWRSRTFEMKVDVKVSGLDYLLTEHPEDFLGTRITTELYDPMMPSDLERTKAEMRKFVAWAPIPITLNGELISKPAAQGKWTYEDEDAYYALSADRQQLAVYNLGVLVNHFYAGRFGMGGTIVTKKRVDVNFARNDIQSSCPVFKRIQGYIRKQSTQAVQKKTKLTDSERDLMAREFIAGAVRLGEISKLRVLTDVHGRAWPLDKLTQVERQFSGRIVVGERGDKVAETAQAQGLAFTLDEGTLERFGVSDAHSFLVRVASACEEAISASGTRYTEGWGMTSALLHAVKRITVIERRDLLGMLDDGYIPIKRTQLTKDQKILLAAVSAGLSPLVEAMNRVGYEDQRFGYRQVHLGTSDVALAWTDGTKNIWVGVEHARLLRRGYAGAHQVALTLLHEMLHTGPDTGTHQHDLAFYQAFHDISGASEDPVGRSAARMMAVFVAQLRQNRGKLGKKLLEMDDSDLAITQARDAALDNEVSELAETIA